MVRLPRNKKQTYRLNSRAQMWPLGLTMAMTLTEFSRSNIEFAISQPKIVRFPRNEQQTYRLNSKASNVAIRLDLGHDLDLEFSRSNMEFPISQPKVVRLPQNEKQTYRLNSRPQMWPMGLSLTITLTIEFSRSNMTLTFDHTHDLDHGFSWSNFEIAVSQDGKTDWHCTKAGTHMLWVPDKGGGSRSFMTMTRTIWSKVRCMDLPDSDWGDFNCRRAGDSSSFGTFVLWFQQFEVHQSHHSNMCYILWCPYPFTTPPCTANYLITAVYRSIPWCTPIQYLIVALSEMTLHVIWLVCTVNYSCGQSWWTCQNQMEWRGLGLSAAWRLGGWGDGINSCSLQEYRQISDISCTNSHTLNVSCLLLQLSLPNPLNSGIKSRMKM